MGEIVTYIWSVFASHILQLPVHCIHSESLSTCRKTPMNNPTLDTIRPLRNIFACQLIPHGEMTRRKGALRDSPTRGRKLGRRDTLQNIKQRTNDCQSHSRTHVLTCERFMKRTNLVQHLHWGHCSKCWEYQFQIWLQISPGKGWVRRTVWETRQMRIRELEELFLTEATGRALCPVMGQWWMSGSQAEFQFSEVRLIHHCPCDSSFRITRFWWAV